MKTPLTIVLANAEILEGETGPNRWLEASKAELRRMKRLIEELLFLARSDAARVPMRRETVPLSDIVWESMLSFEVVGYERRVHTTSEIQPDILLTGDADMLRRVVTILLDNATKYAPQGGSVSVSLAREQDRAVLRVHNTGQPIPQEQLDRLFDRFYRADAARAREDGGFGLGLAIARDIVDMHRGEITAGSDADGVTFCVRLPVRRDAA